MKPTNSPLMELQGITKRFGTFSALKSVDLTIRRGEVHVLLGENGAGKSTMMNVISGLYQPSDGTLLFNGKKTRFKNPQEAKSRGIAMVHQHFMLIDAMTVIDNIILCSKDKRSIFLKKDLVSERIRKIQSDYDLPVDIHSSIADLSVGEQQKVEIIKALYNEAELFILDEPTAVLTDEEAAGLFRIVDQLISENKAVIFISHKLREVMQISKRVSVLRHGELITTVDTSEMSEQKLADLMVGTKVHQQQFSKITTTAASIFRLKNVSLEKSGRYKGIQNIDLSIRPGEILGIAGVDGNGQSELAGMITGLLQPSSGERQLKGTPVNHFKPIDFINRGVVHIPEDRNRQGLVGGMTIFDNIAIKELKTPAFSKGKGAYLLLDQHKSHAAKMVEKYDIRCSGIADLTKNLSGGNQQKVILSRELESNPEIIVAMHPTRGLDIGATNFVHENLIKARDKGCAVVMISADLDEVIKVSDRLIVMFEGEIMGEMSGENPNIQQLSTMMGGTRHEAV